MSAEESFERIETDLTAIAAALRGVAEAQRMNAETLSQLMKAIGAYADSADARMKRIEDNLDGLIRAITAEHANGRSGR